ncbi:MAG TPA: 16S rRNA (guanine(527)-N(7))-methyltransferase RsmG [Anaerolineales bacterium]|nr:16S rRNA (guanine(527)-N(7))-methyltransferase RsmG [Anaerolineales bacterium]
MEKLIAAAKQILGLDLTPPQVAAFRTYAAELAEWNDKFNLTAIKDPAGIEIKHFADSLSCLLAIRPTPNAPRSTLIDVGTGAGFPGVPLKIVCPEMRLTLVESVGKKVTFLNHLVGKLELKDVTVIKARAEEVGRDAAHRERYDWAVARAVAEMPTLLEYLLPLVKRGGKALAQKGESAPAETHGAEHAAKLLGGCLAQIMPVELPGVVEPRYLVVFDKIAATPSKYPRRPGVPGKEPLK